MNKIKDASSKINFSEEFLWKHKDGSMELIPTMPTRKLQGIILPEVEKRINEKSSSVALFRAKKEIVLEVLIGRGVLQEEALYDRKVIDEIKQFPVHLLERALEELLEDERMRVNKQ
jgi:hypothetical protein